uniref:hypothetical protein n=1 Tax=Ignavibacterium sp. TaxID=2651167 RepID=UPI0025BC42E3
MKRLTLLFQSHRHSVIIFVFLLMFFSQQSLTYGQFDDNFFVTNEFVSDIIKDSNYLYLGGMFNYVGPNTGRGVILDYVTGQYDAGFPKVNGPIYTCISDNNGGWFIGGSFSKVGSQYRNNLAHITSSYVVSSWNPGTNGDVRTLFLDGNTLYVGGAFTIIGGTIRNFAGAVDAINGTVTGWNPDPNGLIWAISAANDAVYIGGQFGVVNNNSNQTPRGNLAKVSKDLGSVLSWQCDVSGYWGTLPFVVYGLQLTNNDSTLYVWGNIGLIGGVTRKGVGRVNTYTSNSVQSWNPNALYSSSTVFAGIVYSVEIAEGDTVFIGGNFTRIRTTSILRNNIAAVTKSGTPTAYSWNPNIYADWYAVTTNYKPEVYTLEIKDSIVYAGGKFNLTGGIRRHNLVAINRSTGLPESWDPHITDSYYNSTNTIVYSLLKSGNGLFVGGSFPSVNGKTRKGLAKIDIQNNILTDWDPQLEVVGGYQPIVEKLALYNSNLYVGGAFDSVNGLPQSTFASIDVNTGLLQNFLPFTDLAPTIEVLKVKNGKLYISGNFSAVGDSIRSRVACIDLNTQQVTAWDLQLPSPSVLYAIAFSDSLIYLSGNFSSIRGTPRNGLAAVDYNFGIPTTWDPNSGNITSGVLDMEVHNNLVYVGGQFDQIGLTTRKCLAAIDFDGNITPWNPIVEQGISITRVWDIDLAGSNLYAGGDFQSVNSTSRKYIASVDAQTGNLNSWNPQILGEVFKIFVDSENQFVYFGGGFTNVDDVANFCFARYLDPSIIIPPSTFQLTVSIGNGWNMVSVPGQHPVDQNVLTWWPGK